MGIFLGGLEGRRFHPTEMDEKLSEVLREIRRFLSGHLESRTRSLGKRLWCEKSPNNLQYLSLINGLFPQARHLCLYRHCLDFVQSATTLAERIADFIPYFYKHKGHQTSALIDYWTEQNRALREFERAHAGRCFSLRYEDLVLDTPRVVGSLFSFLRLDWDERLLDQVFSAKHDKGVEDENIRFTSRILAHRVGSGRTLSLEGVSEELLDGMREMLQELGYPAEYDSPAEPQAPAAGSGSEAPILSWLFESHFREQLRNRPAGSSNGSSYRFDITGGACASWLVDLRESEPKISAGGGEAACVIEMSAGDLIAIAEGKLNPMVAFQEGRLRIMGRAELSELQELTLLLTVPSSAVRPARS